MASGDYAQTQVPLVFVEAPPQPARREPERRGGGGGILAVLLLVLLGAAIAGAAGLYYLWQGETEKVAAAQAEVANAQKANKLLADEKTALTAQLAKAQQSLVPYGEIERLKAANEAERVKIAELLKIPSKVDYWKYNRPVDMSDPIIREPAERALAAKLVVLQKLSNDIGLWTKPAGPAPTPSAGAIRPTPPT
jgi:hypothetical protein